MMCKVGHKYLQLTGSSFKSSAGEFTSHDYMWYSFGDEFVFAAIKVSSTALMVVEYLSALHFPSVVLKSNSF